MLSVTEVLGKYSDFSMVSQITLESACEKGSKVHRYAASYATGLWSPIDVDIEGFCRSFASWFDAHVIEVVAVEQRLYSRKHGYCGQPDFIGKLKGDKQLRVIDWKTPLAIKEIWYAQCSAYKNLAHENGMAIKSAGVLRLKKDGSQPIYTESHDNDRDFQAFLNALWAHKYFIKED